MFFKRHLSRAVFPLLALLGFVALPSQAATFTVTNNADTGDGNCTALGTGGGCTLREAISAANRAAGADAIKFDATVFNAPQTISVSSALPPVADDVTITGPAARVTVKRRATASAFDIVTVSAGVAAKLRELTIGSGGYGVNNYGALTLVNCTVRDCSYGIYNNIGGTVTAANCTLSRNFGVGIVNGGTLNATDCVINGIVLDSPRITSQGINNYTGGTMSATNCTVSGHFYGIINAGALSVTNCTVSNNDNFGILSQGTVTAVNCTLTRNFNYSIYNNTGGTVDATNCTVSGINNFKGTVTLKNTIAIGHSGTITDGGHNILSGTEAQAGLELDNTGLPLLKDNGGPTKTIALLSSGTAVNAGSYALIPSGVTTDQRGAGFPRIVGGRVDIGAVESAFTPTGTLVTTTADEDDGTSDPAIGTGTSLREAINYANAHTGADTITFDDTVFNPPQTITLNSALPDLTDEVTITGPEAGVTVQGDANGSFDIFTVKAGVKTTFSGLTIHNDATGIVNLGGTVTANKCTLSGNGTGIVHMSGTLTAINCKINNTNDGILNIHGRANVTYCILSGNSSGISNVLDCKVTVTNCTFSNNGYGISNNSSGTMIVTNCTVSGASTAGIGNSGTLTATNCTVAGSYNGIYNNGGTLTLANSLVVGNATNISGDFTDSGHNITNGTAAQAGLDPTGLQDNGGPTPTIALLVGSAAINAGDNALIPGSITTDQRGSGFARVQGGTVDIGAFEAGVVSVNDLSRVREGSASAPGSATFTVTLSARSTQPVTVNYATADGVNNGAKAGSDYVAQSGTLTFAPGETSKTVKVIFVGDDVAELNEPFFLDLKPPTGATIVKSRGAVYIKNDDGPSMRIDNATTVNEGNSGTHPQVFTVHLSAASTDKVTVDWATANNTAGPADYVVASGTLTFAPGQTSKLIVVQIKGDTTVEPSETYRVKLAHPTFAVLTDSSGIGYIRNDDVAPSGDDAPSQ